MSISILLVFLYFFKKIKSNENFVNQVIPEIIELYDSGQIGKAFLKSKALFEEYPSNEIIENYFKKSSRYAYLKTDTSGVDVSVQYAEDSIYNYIGQTPIDSFLVPNTWPSHKLKLTYNNVDFVKERSDNHNYRFPRDNPFDFAYFYSELCRHGYFFIRHGFRSTNFYY